MTYDPNDNRPDLRDRRTDHVTTNVDARSRGASWMPWVVVLAVLLIGAFIWSNMGAEPGTDPVPTASTTPEATDTAPDPVPAAPEGVVNDAAPASPAPAAPAGNGG
ncbi:hypothetical protein ABID21_000540 [Pseudorhizobium tarimense]|uniref:Uncharacterized protein n=1 Tax=Pseudorhizobium tarimense TaxID=1079109 RepID=A0ABV2H1M9_9HYPH|nr:hypothetical protein [Pseudorhizobium tarimense]MCJ8517936.1 hypothetical protein [Pseudorhizobium tarimense]